MKLFLFQFLVSEDGHCGLCYEHSAAEGPPVAVLLNYVLERRCVNAILQSRERESEGLGDRDGSRVPVNPSPTTHFKTKTITVNTL